MNFIRALYVGINNNFSKYEKEISYTLLFDRILDAENQIYIGIGSADNNKSLQVIRIGDYTQKYYRLINFEEKQNELKYEFENDIKLILKKKDNIKLELFNLNNDIYISKEIHPTIIKYFKPIKLSGASDELDKIYNLFNDNINIIL